MTDLSRQNSKGLLRFLTAGSVDDGKSTLVGRLLMDSENLYDDHIAAAQRKSGRHEFDLAEVTDGLKAEREQGITIDVAYRYFSTAKRKFIIADTPGHFQHTRNMATGASRCQLALLLIDARKGLTEQTCRHASICSLLGVPRFLVVINKMDLVEWQENVFQDIRKEVSEFCRKLAVKHINFIPVSALKGDGVVKPSQNMPWYSGQTVLDFLDDVYIDSDLNSIDFRYPVQTVLNVKGASRYYAGRVESGSVSLGDEVINLGTGQRGIVSSLNGTKGAIQKATAPFSIRMGLDRDLDVSRGDMLVRLANQPKSVSEFDAMVVWMNDHPSQVGNDYILKHTTQETQARIVNHSYKLNVTTLSRQSSSELKINEIGRLRIRVEKPIHCDDFSKNPATGSFILIDKSSDETLAAGLITERSPESLERISPHSENISRQQTSVSSIQKETLLGQSGSCIWMTGLSGSGKTTVAKSLETRLHEQGYLTVHLDGDNLRYGLCRGLGFSESDRHENIRRVAEMARQFVDCGVIVISSLISPRMADRKLAKDIIGADRFSEVYLNASLGECERRDVKGLYKKARSGIIKNFTGISAPYEIPDAPQLVLESGTDSTLEQTEQIIQYMYRCGLFPR